MNEIIIQDDDDIVKSVQSKKIAFMIHVNNGLLQCILIDLM